MDIILVSFSLNVTIPAVSFFQVTTIDEDKNA
jgi:hypothetical protein